MEKYKVNFKCFNCQESIEIEIEKGITKYKFLENNKIICKNCGCGTREQKPFLYRKD